MRVQTGSPTFIATAAMAPYLRVKLSGGKLVAAGAVDNEVGTLESRVLAADAPAAVVPKNAEGTIKMVAAGAISKFANVYGAAAGKIDDVVNANFIGMAMAATSGDGSLIEVIRQTKADELDQLGALDGNLVIDDDFIDDWPAAGTALPLGSQPWLKVETLGLGVIDSVEANGVKKFVFDAILEAATAALYMPTTPFDVDQKPIFEIRLAVFEIGDDAALDINFGLASGTHATDFDSVGEYVAFHLDGTDLSIKCQSEDGATTRTPVDTLLDLTDDVYAMFKIDVTDKADVKFFVDLDGNGYVRVATGTTFTLANYSGQLTPIVHVEKSSNDTLADVRADRIRVQSVRN